MSELGRFLKEKRTAAKLSQSTVAKELGYSTSQFISNHERGISNPTVSSIKKIGEMYNVKPEVILNLMADQEAEKARTEIKAKFAAT